MAPYRCYLLDMDRIAAMQVVECENDADAVLEAERSSRYLPAPRQKSGTAIARYQSSAGKVRQPKEPKGRPPAPLMRPAKDALQARMGARSRHRAAWMPCELTKLGQWNARSIGPRW